MKLDRLVLVNWGQIRPGEYDMGDMTLLTGQTGSGKSTMLDALQTVMTAAYQGIFNYNPGQDEVSQGQRRGKTKSPRNAPACSNNTAHASSRACRQRGERAGLVADSTGASMPRQ